MKFRHHAAITVAAAVAFLGALSLVQALWFLAPILLIPLVVAIWSWRAGTDAGPQGLRVRALLGERRLPWSEINEIIPVHGGKVVAVLANDTAVTLPAVRASDLPRLAAAAPSTR